MPKSILSQIEGRLIALRVPAARRKSALQELNDHREDLIQAALADGLSETEAGARADNSLGDPSELADQIALAARKASWAGNHPVITFCVLPPVVTFFAIFLVFWVLQLLIPPPIFTHSSPAEFYKVRSVYFEQIDNWARWAELMLMVVVSVGLPLGFCKVALDAGIKRYWIWTACLICSIQGYLWQVFVYPQGGSIGYHVWPLQLVHFEGAVIPFAIALFVELRQRRQLRNAPQIT